MPIGSYCSSKAKKRTNLTEKNPEIIKEAHDPKSIQADIKPKQRSSENEKCSMQNAND